MHCRNIVRLALTGALCIAPLGGCSGSPAQPAGVPLIRTLKSQGDTLIIAPQNRLMATPSLGSDVQAAVHHLRSQFLFASDYGRNRIDRWKVLSRPDGSAPTKWYSAVSEAQGLAVVGGSLWIANTGAYDILKVDATDHLAKRLEDPHEFPVNLAFSSKKLYVANIFNSSFRAGDIVYYTNYNGADPKPSGSLKNATFYQVIGIGVDRAGDVFASNNTQNFAGGEVVEFSGGSGTGTVLTNIALSIAGGLAIDPKTQDLLVVDQSASNGKISVYAPPYTGSALKTYNISQIVDIALDARGENLYCANTGGKVDVYGYPSGSFEGSYDGVFEPIGVAVQPSAAR